MTQTFLGVDRPTATTEAIVLGAALATVYPDRDPHATGGAAAIRVASGRLGRFVGNYDFDTGAPFAAWVGRVGDGGDVNTTRADADGNRRRITTTVGSVIATERMPVLLGGDDSVATPFVAGWRDQPSITVVQIDAHLDFRDEVNGEAYGYSSPMRRASEMEWVRRIIHIGQRGVGSARPGDIQDSLAAGNTIIPAQQLARMGPTVVAEQLGRGERFVIAFDVDGSDPAELPAVRAPVAGGPGIAQIGELIGALSARGSLQGLVVTEFEPDLDPSGRSALTLARLVCRALEGRFTAAD
jgi:agmatinase